MLKENMLGNIFVYQFTQLNVLDNLVAYKKY